MEQTREKKLLVLTSQYGEHVNDRPLTIDSLDSYAQCWANVVAYEGCVTFCQKNITPEVGDMMNIRVFYPFCCREGEVFSVHYRNGFVTFRLLNIKKYQVYKAKLHVKVIETGNYLSYVRPVPEAIKQQLESTKQYKYKGPDGDELCRYEHVSADLVRFTNSFGGGDVCSTDYVYTDADGIDHLVESHYHDFTRNEVYYGDKVLGCHRYSPYFPPVQKLPDGSNAPHIPAGFEERLLRHVSSTDSLTFLRAVLKDIQNSGKWKEVHCNTSNGMLTDIYVLWIGNIEVEEFVHVLKNVLEKLKKSYTLLNRIVIRKLYNDVINELAKKSANGSVLLKYKYKSLI